LAAGLLRLYGVGVELAESVFSQGDTGTFTPYKLQAVMHGGATKRPARFRILLDTPYVWMNAARRCALGEGSETFVNQTTIPHLPTRHVSTNGSETCTREGRIALFTNPRAVISPHASPPFLKPRRLPAPGRRQRPHSHGPQIQEADPPRQSINSSGHEHPSALHTRARPYLPSRHWPHAQHTRTPLHPEALASVPYGVVLVRVRVRQSPNSSKLHSRGLTRAD